MADPDAERIAEPSMPRSRTTTTRSSKGVAEASLERDELDRDTFNEMVGDHEIYVPVFEVQKRHGPPTSP